MNEDDDSRATKPYTAVKREPARRRSKVQVRRASEEAAAAASERGESTTLPFKRPRIRARSRPGTGMVERPADVTHLARLLRRTIDAIVHEEVGTGEAWVRDDKGRLHVFDGEGFIDDFWATPSAKARDEQLDALLARGGGEPALLRRTFWQVEDDLFVEAEVCGDEMFIVRGQAGAAPHTERRLTEDLAGARKVLRAIGRAYSDFVEIGDFVPILRRRRREHRGLAQLPLLRRYRRPVRGSTREVTVGLAGNRLFSNSELPEYDDRTDVVGVIEHKSRRRAETALERWILQHRRERYFLATLLYDAKVFKG